MLDSAPKSGETEYLTAGEDEEPIDWRKKPLSVVYSDWLKRRQEPINEPEKIISWKEEAEIQGGRELTNSEKKLAGQAKMLMQFGNYKKALKILLLMVSNPRLRKELSLLGKIIGCYRKLAEKEREKYQKLTEKEREEYQKLTEEERKEYQKRTEEERKEYQKRAEEYDNDRLKYCDYYLEMAPRSEFALRKSIGAAKDLGKWALCLNYCKKYLAIEPADSKVLETAALAAKNLGRWEEVLNYGSRYLSVSRGGNDVPVLGMLTLAAKNLKEWEMCFDYAESYLKLDPDSAAHLGMITEAAYNSSKWSDCRAYGRRYLALKPNDRRIEKMLAVAARILGNYEEFRSHKKNIYRGRKQPFYPRELTFGGEEQVEIVINACQKTNKTILEITVI